jgi:leader peptidase (prepilin peptidase)/N-methyltransferase
VSPTLLLVLLVVAGAGVGLLSGRELATGGYRIEEDRPSPHRQPWWWPAVGLAALWGVLVDRLAGSHLLALPAFLLLAWIGVVITWIDADVQRIPVGIVLPAWEPMALLIGIPLLVEHRWREVAVGAAVWVVVFGLLTLLGGMGAGDTRLAPMVGATTGLLGVYPAVAAIMVAFIAGGIWAVVLLLGRRVGLKTHLAFGPFMCLGALAAALLP